MIPVHYSVAVTWKVLGGLSIIGMMIYAAEPTVKVAYITGGALVLAALVNATLGILSFIRQGKTGAQVDRIEISTNSNTTRILDKLDEQQALLKVKDAELKEARSRADHVEGYLEGDQSREGKGTR